MIQWYVVKNLRIRRDETNGDYGCYWIGSGRIGVRRDISGWLLYFTVLHELVHWFLDCFRASYYRQIQFDALSARWFPTDDGSYVEYIYLSKVLERLRAANLHRAYREDPELTDDREQWKKIHDKSFLRGTEQQ